MAQVAPASVEHGVMSLSPSAIPLQQADLEESGAVLSAELVSGVLDDCIDSNNSRLSPESLSASGKFLAATSSVGDHEEISLEMALPFLIGSGFSEMAASFVSYAGPGIFLS